MNVNEAGGNKSPLGIENGGLGSGGFQAGADGLNFTLRNEHFEGFWLLAIGVQNDAVGNKQLIIFHAAEYKRQRQEGEWGGRNWPKSKSLVYY